MTPTPTIQIPDPVESRRASSGRVVRVIYATGIIALGVAVAWHYGSALVFLEGFGSISAKRFVLSAPFPVHINQINVVPGSRVKAGDVLAEVSSFQIEQYISDLLRSISDQTSKEADLQIKLSVSRSTINPSRKRLDIAKSTLAAFEATTGGTSSYIYRTEVYRENANAQIAFSQAESEAAEIAVQLSRLIANRNALEERMANISKEFNDGKIVAPIDGIVSAAIGQSGGTIIPGNSIAEIYDSSDLYVDWEMPLRRLIEPKVGDAVYITSGYSVIEGTITKIFPISTKLGSERKDNMSRTYQGQTVRVRNHGFDEFLALDSQVTVRMNYSRLTNWFFNVFRSVFRNE